MLRMREKGDGMETNTTEIITIDQLVEKMLRISADSPVFKKIAAYIEQHYMQIIFMTAGELASVLSVSQGSVSKFCIALGYQGYADFLRNLQKFIGKTITAPERYYYTSTSTHHTDEVIDQEVENIRMLKEITTSEDYQRLVEVMASAGEVVLLSARMSATLLPYLKYILDKLRDRVSMATPDTSEWNYLGFKKNIEEIAVIAVGMPRYPRVMVEKLKELKERGFHIYVITDSRFSPLCSYGELSIFIPTTVASLFDVYSTPMAFFNLLLRDVSQKLPEMQERLDAVERQDAQQRNYYS